jgi:hypothetical protein
MTDTEELCRQVADALEETFGDLRKPVVRNLGHLVVGLVMALRVSRGWYGRLSLSGISRGLQTSAKVKARYKRLHRFLDNPRFRMDQLSGGLLRLAGGTSSGLLPLVVDQTAVGEVQVVTGSYPVVGRAIPVAMATFEYSELVRGQNILEEDFLGQLAGSVPGRSTVVWIMDRGYARASLLALCRTQGWLHIIRGQSGATVAFGAAGKARRLSLGRLRHRQGKARRYRGVLYHRTAREKVDVVVYRERGFKEPWFLLVPAGSEESLSTETVVRWYRARMTIEVSFRDFKSWLGVRGLHLKVRRAERLGRLLAGLAIAYVLLLALGESPLAEQLRRDLEITRGKPRHGTRRTLGVLCVALMAVTDSFLLSRSNLIAVLLECLGRLRRQPVCMVLTSG